VKLISKNIPLNCEIALHGDTHIGNAFFHRKGLTKFISWLGEKPKSRFFVHMGDIIEAREVNHKYYRVGEMSEPIPLQQIKEAQNIYEPVKKQCLVALKGNHEDDLIRFGNLAQHFCEQLNIDYGTWTTILTLKNNNKQLFKVFLTHKTRHKLPAGAKDYEQKRGNMVAALKNSLKFKHGGCLVMAVGHTHKLLIVPPSKKLIISNDDKEIKQTYLSAGDGEADYIEEDRRWYVNTGSFLKLYINGIDGYAERAGLDPIILGYPVCIIRKGKLIDIQEVTI